MEALENQIMIANQEKRRKRFFGNELEIGIFP